VKSRLVMAVWGYIVPGDPGWGIRYTDAGRLPANPTPTVS